MVGINNLIMRKRHVECLFCLKEIHTNGYLLILKNNNLDKI